MSTSFRLKTAKTLLVVNAIFWLVAAVYALLSNHDTGTNAIVVAMLFAEPVVYLVAVYGVAQRIKLFYLFALLLTLGNTVLSITDEIGWLDMLSLVLSFAAFVSLLALWHHFMANGARSGAAAG